MSDNALEITSVTKRFPASGKPVVAVRDLNLSVRRGEIVAVLGPNGAGKTTTLDTVLGLTEPTSGTVTVFGRKPRQAVTAGDVSAVLQSGGLLPDLTVAETIRMIASLYPRTIGVDEAISRAGIERIANRKVSKCSGGEQQRLRFALALLPAPDLIILDEPTAGMDVNARHEFWDAMKREAREGRTILFATHYLQEADDFAERIVLIANGEIVADGTSDEIRGQSGSRRTVRATWPGAGERDLAAVPGATDFRIDGDHVSFTVEDSDTALRHLLTNTPAHDLDVQVSSLDDAFTRLTGIDSSELAATV